MRATYCYRRTAPYFFLTHECYSKSKAPHSSLTAGPCDQSSATHILFPFQQELFSGHASAIPGKAVVATYNAMTWDKER